MWPWMGLPERVRLAVTSGQWINSALMSLPTGLLELLPVWIRFVDLSRTGLLKVDLQMSQRQPGPRMGPQQFGLRMASLRMASLRQMALRQMAPQQPALQRPAPQLGP